VALVNFRDAIRVLLDVLLASSRSKNEVRNHEGNVEASMMTSAMSCVVLVTVFVLPARDLGVWYDPVPADALGPFLVPVLILARCAAFAGAPSRRRSAYRENARQGHDGSSTLPVYKRPRKRPFVLDLGRGEVIRTLDPLHPMQVRYQAALRPDRTRIIRRP
jgi:hypothetical protein